MESVWKKMAIKLWTLLSEKKGERIKYLPPPLTVMAILLAVKLFSVMFAKGMSAPQASIFFGRLLPVAERIERDKDDTLKNNTVRTSPHSSFYAENFDQIVLKELTNLMTAFLF